eukprot:scaffold30615_cov64-Phaeocystis_antarctica.AAC.9
MRRSRVSAAALPLVALMAAPLPEIPRPPMPEETPFPAAALPSATVGGGSQAVAEVAGPVKFVAPALASAGAGPLTTLEAIGPAARPPRATVVQPDSVQYVRMGTKPQRVVGVERPADLAGIPTPPAVVAMIRSVSARHHSELTRVPIQARLVHGPGTNCPFAAPKSIRLQSHMVRRGSHQAWRRPWPNRWP